MSHRQKQPLRVSSEFTDNAGVIHTPGAAIFEYPLGSLKKGDITKDYGVVISRRRYRGMVKLVCQKETIINGYFFPIAVIHAATAS